MREDDVLDTIEYKGYTIKVYADEMDYSPREDSNLGTMACWHRHYSLGDIQPEYDPAYYLASLLYDKGELSDEQLDSYYESYIDSNLLKKFDKYFIWLPIYAYEHSGITISTSRSYPYNDVWDSGQLGIIYVDKAKVKTEYKWKHLTSQRIERIENYLQGEVNTYDDFLTGNVYGFKMFDEDDEEIDSCWGYFGDYDKYMIPECKSTIDYLIEQHNKQAKEENDYLFSNTPVYVGI